MPFSEKLALLEAVWAELSAEPDQIEVPQWHKDILDERMAAAESGSAGLVEWEVAKEQIKQRVNHEQ